VTGFAGMLLAIDADSLWRVTIRKNMRVENDPFTWTEAGQDALAYVRGEVAVEPGLHGQWRVVSPHLNRELGTTANRADAQALAIALERTMELEEAAESLGYNPRWRV